MATATIYSAASAAGKHHDGGVGGVEFVVHTKHTCDKCFQRPILGQRYNSHMKPNFDLCARCFEKYTGPDIGLKEEVLVRDTKISHDFVLKLKIDNGGDVQIRRMKVEEIWDKSSSNLSYAKVLSIAAGFTDVAHDSFVANAKATYTDEDGDEVNISSDGELKDAFLQAIAMLPVRKPFLINVTAPKAKVTVPTTNNKATGMPQRIQLKKVEPAKKAVTVSMGRSPIIMGCHARNVLRITPKDFENQSFVHARHTCDGCSKSPIIGTRYHATKIPDFDLCAACFKEYEGDDLDFTPEIQGRDLRMQPKWLKTWVSSDFPIDIAGLTELAKKIQEPKTPESKPSPKVAPGTTSNESFLSDADGIGSIAEVIGRTLDVCVAAVEEWQKEVESNEKESYQTPKDNATTATAAAASTESVAASDASAMTELEEKVDESMIGDDANLTKSDDLVGAAASVISMPSTVTGLKSEDFNEIENGSEFPKVDDASTAEDGWSVVSDDN